MTKTQRIIVYPILAAFLVASLVGGIIGNGVLLIGGGVAVFLGCQLVEAFLLKR